VTVERHLRAHAEQGTPVRLMFEDEGRFGRITQPRRCWAPAGVRPRVPAQFVREYTHVFAAVSPHDGAMVSLILPEVNAEAMSIFLGELGRRHPDEFILLVLDGAGWHRAKRLQIPENIFPVPLPPYSPELNPLEHLWDELREKWFQNLVFNNIDAVEDRLVEALSTLERDASRVFSITAFPWIVSIPMTAT